MFLDKTLIIEWKITTQLMIFIGLGLKGILKTIATILKTLIIFKPTQKLKIILMKSILTKILKLIKLLLIRLKLRLILPQEINRINKILVSLLFAAVVW